jgi:ABC-type sugar transport system ATPase subunit
MPVCVCFLAISLAGDLMILQVLYKVKGVCKPGQVMALMGPSGSGKTSLLSVIGGRTPKLMKSAGKVLFGGRSLSRQVKRNIGYVMQDDVLFDALTVEETLLYAARLRMSKDVPLCVPSACRCCKRHLRCCMATDGIDAQCFGAKQDCPLAHALCQVTQRASK